MSNTPTPGPKRDGGPAVTNDGGPAFPMPPVLHEEGGPNSYWSQHPAPGMSLRAYVAAKVLAQLAPRIVFPQSVEDQLHAAGIATEDFEAYGAHLAVGFADALIERLESDTGGERFPDTPQLADAADLILAARERKGETP